MPFPADPVPALWAGSCPSLRRRARDVAVLPVVLAAAGVVCGGHGAWFGDCVWWQAMDCSGMGVYC